MEGHHSDEFSLGYGQVVGACEWGDETSGSVKCGEKS